MLLIAVNCPLLAKVMSSCTAQVLKDTIVMGQERFTYRQGPIIQSELSTKIKLIKL